LFIDDYLKSLRRANLEAFSSQQNKILNEIYFSRLAKNRNGQGFQGNEKFLIW